MDNKERVTRFKRKYLEQIGYIKNIIVSNEKLLESKKHILQNNIKPLDYSKEQIKGGNKYSWENLIYESDELEREIFDDNVKLMSKQREIFNVIKNVNDFQLRLLLQYRYIECKDWRYIEAVMDMATTTRAQMHSRALSLVKLPKDIKLYKKI